MKISLGPVQYYWAREFLLDFYANLPHKQLAAVYLGEVVCGRRQEMRVSDWIALARDLASTGVEVVLSTQALIESDADLRNMVRLAENGEFRVEANDMGAVQRMARRTPFVAGPHLNVYNHETLGWLNELGATRWVMPVELGQQALKALQEIRPPGVETEIFGFGRLPLAFSARCFTARHYNLPKDDCRFRCIDHPDGLQLATRENQPFLALNGIQTQSSKVFDLVREMTPLRLEGVDLVRLSPQSSGMRQIISIFDRAARGQVGASEAELELSAHRISEPCNGFWYSRPGIEHGLP